MSIELYCNQGDCDGELLGAHRCDIVGDHESLFCEDCGHEYSVKIILE